MKLPKDLIPKIGSLLFYTGLIQFGIILAHLTNEVWSKIDLYVNILMLITALGLSFFYKNNFFGWLEKKNMVVKEEN